MWAEFDPLRQVRTAVPVISTDNAEARPVFSTPGTDSEVLVPTSDFEVSRAVANANNETACADTGATSVTETPAPVTDVASPELSPRSSRPSSEPGPISQDEASTEEKKEEFNENINRDSMIPESAEVSGSVFPSEPALEVPEVGGRPEESTEAAEPSELGLATFSEESANVSSSTEPLNRRSSIAPADASELRRSSIATMRELGDPQSFEGDNETLPFDFQAFLDLMRQRSADPVVRYAKSFLQEFSKKAWTPQQQEKIVADFHRFIMRKMRQFEPFASLSEPNFRNAGEGMEKLIMNRLYVRTYPPKMAPILRRDGHDEDLLKDQLLSEKMRLWGWVEGRHLDINDEYLQPQFLKLASAELGRLHLFRAPRDKMICILNCSKVVWALIRQAHLEQNADSFLPLLIYVVLKAQPENLVSNINYIQRFRAPEYQKGETAYYLSTLASAVAFIEGLDKTSLTITDEEFEDQIEKAAKIETERRKQLADDQEHERQQHQHKQQQQIAGGQQTPGESTPPVTTTYDDDFGIESVLAASAGMLVDRVKSLTTRIFDDIPEVEQSQSEAGTEGQDTGHQARGHRRYESQEERAARLASAEEYRAQQKREREFAETLESLENMFPLLDKDLIEDVLRQKDMNVGAAVDVCLTLVGS